MNELLSVTVAAVLGTLLLSFAIHARAARARRRDAAAKVATKLTQMGLTVIPAILTDYSEGNYPKLIYDLEHAATTLLDPAKAADEFDQLCLKMSAAKISDPNQVTAFLKYIAQQAKAAGVGVPTV